MARNNRAVKQQEPEAEPAPAEAPARRVGDQAPAVDINTFNREELLAQYKTKSNVIRFLTTQGQTRADIARFLDIRYQHVRNVLTQPLKQPQPQATAAREVETETS